MQKSSDRFSSCNSGNNGSKLGWNVDNGCTSVLHWLVLPIFPYRRTSVSAVPHILVIGLIGIYIILQCYYSGYCIEILKIIQYKT